ncbi:hypothetical protein D6855_12780 [Butyrivibrio sp. CB08]|uniref:hypothetical protein n=1 Tax=Butyrivibrio sp. CB08 TaxID=2364879 RepID=UPI000EA9DB15|nr:hypothetical protein [Butyrivibrio sp. CB08]RKM57918.1 hypothetical protein D6855_12780 [Butyrivibrio sp. CB08]
MSFDISKLTSAVNKYLNSISEISLASKRAQEEIAAKTQFSTELSSAIQQNIENRIHDQVTMPDIGKQVQDTVEAKVQQAVSSIDNTFEQLNGAFEEIRKAGAANAVTDTDKAVEATKAADATNPLAKAVASGTAASGITSTTGATGANALNTNTNRDAYSGTLSTEALQDLSKSQYFSANLIQSSLFNEGNDSENKSSNGTSAFDTVSLSDLNTNSLLANALTSGNVTNALTSGNVATETATTSNATNNTSDLAKALIKAYTSNASSAATTSIFGDFTL